MKHFYSLLGTVDKYLKFFSFALREKRGEGVEASENRKLEEKPEENIQGGGVVKPNLRENRGRWCQQNCKMFL